jgi:hypothetical protein
MTAGGDKQDGTDPRPLGSAPEVQRTLGRTGGADLGGAAASRVDLASSTAPAPKRRQAGSPAGLSLRGPKVVAKTAGRGKVTEKADQTREHLEQAKQARQKSVWDKLDAARSAAANKQTRLQRFDPRAK